MDKGAERTALREVYGPAVERAATDHERPDFLLTLPGVGILGIEATSVFAGSGAAKLHHLADYSLGLLDGTQPVHRADRSEFIVDDVTIEREDGTKVATVRAIINGPITKLQQWEILRQTVEDKAQRISAYLSSCDQVDLLVADPSALFWHKEPEEFQGAFKACCSKEFILRVPFREIHLITLADTRREVVALRGSTFAADVLAYVSLLESRLVRGARWRGLVSTLARALHAEGYRDLLIDQSGNEWGVHSGGWEVHCDGRGEWAIRDWLCPPTPYPGRSVSKLGALGRRARKDVQRLVRRRKRLSSTVHLVVPLRRHCE